MEPSEVRGRVLRDHTQLRRDLVRVEGIAREVLDGLPKPISAVRAEAEELVNRLFAHMRWEESHLLPALRDADAWGPERAELLVQDHRAQRDMLEFALARLRDVVRPSAGVARDILYLVDRLREDMRVEEQDILDERALRDDVIGIAVETG
jgi:hemerythrin HHE cation binding domain-containing protein